MVTFRYIFAFSLLFGCNVWAFDIPKSVCSSHCTLAHKESADCWNETSTFFEEVLLDQIKGYILAQAGIAAWKSENNEKMDWDDATKKSIDRMVNIDPPDIEDENDITDREVYSSVVTTLISNAKEIDKNDPHLDFIPCPKGCEIEHETYKRMFIGSVIGSGVLFVLIAVLSVYQYRRVKNSVKKEANAALQAYELNLTNKNKQTFKLIDVEF